MSTKVHTRVSGDAGSRAVGCEGECGSPWSLGWGHGLPRPVSQMETKAHSRAIQPGYQGGIESLAPVAPVHGDRAQKKQIHCRWRRGF